MFWFQVSMFWFKLSIVCFQKSDYLFPYLKRGRKIAGGQASALAIADSQGVAIRVRIYAFYFQA
jgi:hypothetical protein